SLFLLRFFAFSSHPTRTPFFASSFYFLRVRPPPRSTLFPYTTLFRSGVADLDLFLDGFAVLIGRALQGALGAGLVDGGQFASADAQALFEGAVGFDLLFKRLLDGFRLVWVRHDDLLLNDLKARREGGRRFHRSPMNLLGPGA